jgi:hypothetical protein
MTAMTKKRMKNFLALSVLIVLTALLGAPSSAPAAPSQTAQGIMVNLQGSGDFIITQNQTWKFCNGPDSCTDLNSNTVAPASSYFTNAWDGNAPTLVSCTPSTKCTNLGTPPAPGAPGADFTWVYGPGHANSYACASNKCTFWAGGDLQGLSYTQTASSSAGSGSTARTATYQYTYNVTPTQTSVAAQTAWYLFQSSGGTTATINIDAQIAGESVVVNNTFKCLSGVPGTARCGKFSFNLGTPGYDATNDRVQNLTVTVTDVTDPNNPVVVETVNPGNTVIDGDPFGSLTFDYTTNAGSNGATQYLQNGDAYSVMTTNDVPGGGFGPTDLEEAIMDTVPATLGPGSYTVTLTGTVKGNSASSNLPFSITNQLHISAENCTN